MRRRLNEAALVLMLPAVLAHELTHATAALPFGRVNAVTIFPPRAILEYPPETSWLAIRFVNLAPTIVGSLVGLPALVMLTTAIGLPVPVVVYLIGSWAIYTLPVSDHDRNPRKHAETA